MNEFFKELARAESERTKATIFVFDNGRRFRVINPLSGEKAVLDMYQEGAKLIGKFKQGKEI